MKMSISSNFHQKFIPRISAKIRDTSQEGTFHINFLCRWRAYKET